MVAKYRDGAIVWQKGGDDPKFRKLLNGPTSMFFDERGRVCIADAGNSRILTVSPKGRILDVIQPGKGARRRLSFPRDLAVQGNRIYVADTLNHQIDIYRLDGRWVRSFGSIGLDFEKLNGPVSVSVSDSREIFVVDRGNRAVKLFSEEGVLLDVFDSGRILGIENFDPSFLALGPDGLLYVADGFRARIVVLTQRGTLVDTIDLTLGDGSRPQPGYLGFKPDGRVVVTATNVLPA